MLRNVVAIVSGGSSGLGAATASYIARSGGRVLVADLPSSEDNYLRLAAVTCAEVHSPPTKCISSSNSNVVGGSTSNSSSTSSISISNDPIMAFSETDVRNEEDIKKALDMAEETFGQPINVAVSCAGIAPARRTISAPKEEVQSMKIHSLDEFNAALQVNTLGTFNLARLAAERMAKREPDAEGLRGCIINTASIAAFEGQTGQVAYAASKGAVVGKFPHCIVCAQCTSFGFFLDKKSHKMTFVHNYTKRHDITSCERFVQIWYSSYDNSTRIIQNTVIRWITKESPR